LARRFLALGVVLATLFTGAIARAALTGRRISAAAITTDPVIVAGGDIACDPADGSFHGGTGTSDKCQQLATSKLLTGAAAGLPLRDNQYYCASSAAFLQSYDVSWGSYKSITHPVVGNHEYLTSGGSGPSTGCDSTNAGAAGYFSYFGTAAGQQGQGYYSYNVGNWHLIALNSNCSSAGGCSSTSPQGKWLTADLAAHAGMCTAAYWHIPLFDTGSYASSNSQTFWNTLYAAGVDVILNGHDHNYQRFAPQTPTGAVDQTKGIREFIVGTGGANLTSYGSSSGNTEARNDSTFGVLKLTLHAGSYEWQFVPVAGKTFSDSGTKTCHASGGGDTVAPTAPTNLTATAVSSNQVGLSWTASTDDVGVAGYQVLRGGVQVATTSSTSYTDNGVAGSMTYQYSVVATDEAGNVSGPSNTVTVTTSSTVLTFAPSDDSFAEQDTPATVYGGSTHITADNSPVKRQFVRFSVSGIGSRAVQSAKLRLYCVDPSDKGGDFHASDATWSESTLTWDVQPAINPTVVSSLGSVSSGTWYEADVTPVVSADGAVSLAATSTSTNGAYYSSKEGTAGLAPQLVVTLEPPDTTPPSAPANVTATAGTSAIHVSWDASTDDVGVTGYRITRTNGATTTTLDAGTATSYDDGGVAVGTTYTYSVQAIDKAGTLSPPSNTATALIPDTTAPTQPTNLSATQGTDSRVHLTWTPASDNVGVTDYRITRTNGATTTTLDAGIGTSYDDSAVVVGTAYTYTVTAYDGAGNPSPASSSATFASADTTSPSAPSNLTGSFVSGAVHLTWGASSDNLGVTGYRITRVSGTTTITIVVGPSTSYNDGNVAASTAYTYSVQALDAAGNASAASNSVRIRTKH